MSNRQMEEMAEARRDSILARELGVTVAELQYLDPELDTECSDDGVPYYTIVRLNTEAPRAILDKINGLDGDMVRLGLNIFDSEE